MNQICNIVELFSGIGSQAKALKNLGYKINTLGTCEWDLHAFIAYDAIHNSTALPDNISEMKKEDILKKLEAYTLSNNGKEKMEHKTLKTYSVDTLRRVYAAIIRCNNFVDVSSLTGAKMPDGIDILTYSFPCQDLSNVGAFHGYNKGIDKDSGSRSSLLWQVGRILKEMKELNKSMPNYLLLENVPTLLSPRHKDNFKTWINELEEIGYRSYYFQLNARSFGLPQNRPRLLMISVFVGNNADTIKAVEEFFEFKTKESIVEEFKKSEYFRDITINELLRTDYTKQQLWDEAVECTPNDTVSRQAIWNENPQLVLEGNIVNPAYDVIRTITTKQDRNPNSGNLYFDCGIEGKGKFRYLTPRECFLFMGFTDEDYDNVIKSNPEIHKNSKLFPRDKLIRMAGNSIPVKLLEGIFYQIKLLDKELNKNGCT
ncbi:MAG: DNA (cytosine-5-)-methyltransferase [Bacteroidales bacterium]|nr:DNA (cytosine-5-)-methyltransferase [Bacteroidales bacterium]